MYVTGEREAIFLPFIKYVEIVSLKGVARTFKDHASEQSNSISFRSRTDCKHGKISRNWPFSLQRHLSISRNNHPQDISMSSKKLPSLPLRPWIITVVAYGIVFLSTGKLLIEAEDKGDIMEKQSWEIGKQRPDDDIQSLMPKLSSACAVTCSDLVSLSNAVFSLYFLNFSLFWFSCFKTKSIMLRIIIS